MDLRGIYPPVPTPFDSAGELDLRALRANIGRWMRTRLRGLVVLGSNGEAALLDEDEADRAIAAAREAVPRDRVLIAGTGRESTRAAIAAARRAATLGADAVLVRTPALFRGHMTADALVRHFSAVADASPVPVLLYNFPAFTGVNLPAEAVARLAPHPNVAGVKASGGDVALLADYVSMSPPGFLVFCGSAQTFYPSLCAGAAGGILAVACVVPDRCLQLAALTEAGRHADALALQRRLTPLARSVTTQYGVPGLKSALEMAGFAGGPPRPPLLPPGDQVREEIRRQLHELDAVPVQAS